MRCATSPSSAIANPFTAAPCDTTASTDRRRARGSRSGPAGSSKPLPKPRESTTAISTSRLRA
jgi:hypothetical protein